MAKKLKVAKPKVTKGEIFDPTNGSVKTVLVVAQRPDDVPPPTLQRPAHEVEHYEWVDKREFPILKAQLTDPMIFGDPSISPFSDEAEMMIRKDMELPLDMKSGPMTTMDYPGANQFRAAIQFDDDPAHPHSLIKTGGIFCSPDDGEIWCKVAVPDPATDECGYVQLPPCPMLFGNNNCASGVFVPFNCSEVGLNNAHKMIDSFCSPLAQAMSEVGVSPIDLYAMIGPRDIKYPCDTSDMPTVKEELE